MKANSGQCMLLICAGVAAGRGRQVAITIDDVPRGGDGGPYDLAGMRAMTEQRLWGMRFPQILLIHANQMNADLMLELLDMFRRRGYTFVTSSRVLEDPVYQLPETYVGRGGFSWIHRWSKSKGMAEKGEPDPAEWVQKAFAEAR